MMFKTLAPLILSAIVGIVIKIATSGKSKKDKKELSLKAKPPLTPREQDFFKLLLTNLPNNIILAQVDLKRIFDGNGFQYMNELGQLSMDFVILNPDYTIKACIELDDSTHGTERAQKNDKKKNDYCKQTGTQFIRFGDVPTKEVLLNKLGAKSRVA